MMQGIPGFIFQVLDSSCFTAAIRFHGLPERSAILSARLVGESEFISLSCCAQELQYLRLLKASIQQSSTVPSATVRAKDDAEHAAHICKRELELDAATMFTASDSDSASTRLSLGRKQTWCEDKLRRGHVGTAFRFSLHLSSSSPWEHFRSTGEGGLRTARTHCDRG